MSKADNSRVGSVGWQQLDKLDDSVVFFFTPFTKGRNWQKKKQVKCDFVYQLMCKNVIKTYVCNKTAAEIIYAKCLYRCLKHSKCMDRNLLQALVY